MPLVSSPLRFLLDVFSANRSNEDRSFGASSSPAFTYFADINGVERIDSVIFGFLFDDVFAAIIQIDDSRGG